MSHTDEQLRGATRVAYLSFFEKAKDNLEADGKKEPFTIRELIYSYINVEEAKRLAEKDGINNITLKDLVKYSEIEELDKSIIIEEFTEDMFDWKIVHIHDTNPENGFYGCVIEAVDNEAIVAFRGSENMKKYGNLWNDWIKANLGLINSHCTEQHVEVAKFADELIKNGIVDKYDSFSATGHSLGGNLATHFAVISAVDNRTELYEKIDRSVNFDGPNFSEKYLEYHNDEIQKASHKITHYKWSLVGCILNEIPNSNEKFISFNEDLEKDNIINRIRYKIISKHRIKNLIFDCDGTVIEGKQDRVAKEVAHFSKTIDAILPTSLTSELFSVAEWIFYEILYEKEDGTIGFKNPTINRAINGITNIKDICGVVLESIINILKNGALIIESTVKEEVRNFKGKITGVKNAFSDVMKAVVNDEHFNINAVNETAEVLNNEDAPSQQQQDDYIF